MQQVEPEQIVPQPSLGPEILAKIEALDEHSFQELTPETARQMLEENGIPFTPDIFIECSMFGWPKLLKLMLLAGMDVNSKRADGGNAMTAACLRGDPAIVQILLDNGADLNSRFNEYEQPCMHFAVHSRKTEMVEFLLKHGVKIDERDKLKRTGLMVAVEGGTLEMVKFLVEHGADVNAEDKDKRTPLQRSVRGGSLEIVKYLVDQGADPNHRDSALGATPIYDAAAFGRADIFDYLEGLGVDTNIKLTNGVSILHIAATGGNLHIVQRLLELGMDVNLRDPASGATPLYAALDSPRISPEIVKLLVDKGADVNLDCRGSTPLMVAVRNGLFDLFKLLLERGADPKPVAPGGLTLLHLATMSNNAELVQAALDLGADPMAKTDDGWTALKIAEENFCDKAIPILRKAMGLPPAEQQPK